MLLGLIGNRCASTAFRHGTGAPLPVSSMRLDPGLADVPVAVSEPSTDSTHATSPLTTTHAPRATSWTFVSVLLLAIWSVFAHLGAAPPGRMSEQRCHRVAVHMVKSGDWVVPIDHGVPRLQKPPLYYWLAATLISCAGTATYAITRAPSAIAAVALLVVLFAWASRRGRPLAGLLAVTLFLAMDQFQDNGRRGDAEMWLALTSVASLWTFERYAASGRARDVVWFAAAFALALLAKATAAFVTVLVPIAVWAMLDANVRRRIDRSFWIALAAATCVGCAWYGLVLTRVVGAWSELAGHAARPLGVDDPGGDADHYRAPYFFVKSLPSIVGPIVVLIPWLFWRAWKQRSAEAALASRAPTLAFAAGFVVFSLLPQKQPHYLLPLLPALCVGLALELARIGTSAIPAKVVRWTTGVVGLGVAAYCAFEAAWARELVLGGDAIAIGLAASGVACAAVALVPLWRRQLVPSWHALAVACAFAVAVRSAHIEPWRATIKAATEGEVVVAGMPEIHAAAKRHPVTSWVFDVDDALERDD